ncbi:MAG: hypothetical protein AB7L76_25315 [Burkholderiaceae bacterium]
MSESAPIDIRADAPYPSGALSNFAPHAFTLDGVACASMEGFLQGLKLSDAAAQRQVCGLVGAEANRAGRQHDWRASGLLWWQGRAIERRSPGYQRLLDRAYQALFEQSASFRDALAASGDAPLTHDHGRTDPGETVLTVEELCSRLQMLRGGGSAGTGGRMR